MALVEAARLCDTILAFIEESRAVYETIIDRYFEGRKLNLFLGKRATIPASSLPAIEVASTNDSLGWHACRVQMETSTIELDIVTDNSAPELAVRLESQLTVFTTSILATPPHLRPRIKGTNRHLYDSLPQGVRYSTAGQGRMHIATITWEGKALEYLANRLFRPAFQINGTAHPVTDLV